MIDIFDIIQCRSTIFSGSYNNELLENILTTHPELCLERDIVKKIINFNPWEIEAFTFNACIELLKDKDFIYEMMNEKVLYIHSQFLHLHPKDMKITRALFEHSYLPLQEYAYLYNEDIYQDTEFIKYCLRKHGETFYRKIPDQMQFDPEFCRALLDKFPNADVMMSSMTSMKEFFDAMDTNDINDVYSVIRNMTKNKFIIENIENIILIFQKMKDGQWKSYIDVQADPPFKEHKTQEFLRKLSLKMPLINRFLSSDFGYEMMNQKIDNYAKYIQFEVDYLHLIGDNLNIFYRKDRLEMRLPLKEDPDVLNKI